MRAMAAEFAQLIAADGAWNNVWLAAHWDRKLKKQDYLALDLRSTIASFIEKRGIISLRSTGHLLLGTCKIFLRKSAMLEDEAREVQTRLMMAFEGDDEGAEGLQGAADSAAAAAADGAAGAFGMLVEVDPERVAASEDAVLRCGKRHVARLEDITLKTGDEAAKRARVPRVADDFFGAVTGRELEDAMSELTAKCLGLAPGDPTAFDGMMQLEEIAYDTQPLVAIPAPSDQRLLAEVPASTSIVPRGAKTSGANNLEPDASEAMPIDDGTPMPLDLDMVPVEDDLQPLAYPSPQHHPSEDSNDELFAQLDWEDPVEAIDAIAERGEPRFAAGVGAGVAAALQNGPEQGGRRAAVVGIEPLEKRRRRGCCFVFDDPTEIPKETYQGFVNDRSSITKKNPLDYTIFLPHSSPSFSDPPFTTTFTDLCPALVECIKLGQQVAARRRQLLQDEGRDEGRAEGRLLTGAPLAAPAAAELVCAAPVVADYDIAGLLSPLMSPVLEPGQSGLRNVEAELPSSSNLDPAKVENDLLANAPESMRQVITGNMDAEDQSGNSLARTGYSARTEKMHRFLAKEFVESSAAPGTRMKSVADADARALAAREQSLSYESLCRQQSSGRRELIAGCFFELLVLKTNGSIGVEQDKPFSDIRISKGSTWTGSR